MRPDKELQRQVIARHTQEFLRKGGKVIEVHLGVNIDEVTTAVAEDGTTIDEDALGSEAADKAFESWFKGLRLDDVVGAACAKVPKKTLRMVFMAGRYYRPRGAR